MKIEIIPFGPDEFYILEDNVVSYIYCDNFTPQFQIGQKMDPYEWSRTSFDEVLKSPDISERRKLQYNVLWNFYGKDYPEYFI
jgi:hypothetical protein